ncbi:MAG: CBS domain-containing protein [Cloacibacterium sp.]|jgi:CBS domain-containing protein|nr:CBS domain-containing protein [Cloacibacterium sp.]
MLIQDYISKDFPAFEPSASVDEAFVCAQDFGFTHVFIKNKGAFQGGICKEFLEEYKGGTLEEVMIHLEKFAVLYENTILDSIRLFHTFNANVVPVINEAEEYLGYIAYDDIFCELSKYPLFSESGALLTVETPLRSFSMTEIAKIVEGNNSKFYGAFVSQITEDTIQVTMRISNENLSSVDETLERYGYLIVRKFYTDGKEALLKDRYEFIQKYLEF